MGELNSNLIKSENKQRLKTITLEITETVFVKAKIDVTERDKEDFDEYWQIIKEDYTTSEADKRLRDGGLFFIWGPIVISLVKLLIIEPGIKATKKWIEKKIQKKRGVKKLTDEEKRLASYITEEISSRLPEIIKTMDD